jgi:hypothetical protein
MAVNIFDEDISVRASSQDQIVNFEVEHNKIKYEGKSYNIELAFVKNWDIYFELWPPEIKFINESTFLVFLVPTEVKLEVVALTVAEKKCWEHVVEFLYSII